MANHLFEVPAGERLASAQPAIRSRCDSLFSAIRLRALGFLIRTPSSLADGGCIY